MNHKSKDGCSWAAGLRNIQAWPDFKNPRSYFVIICPGFYHVTKLGQINQKTLHAQLGWARSHRAWKLKIKRAQI